VSDVADTLPFTTVRDEALNLLSVLFQTGIELSAKVFSLVATTALLTTENTWSKTAPCSIIKSFATVLNLNNATSEPDTVKILPPSSLLISNWIVFVKIELAEICSLKVFAPKIISLPSKCT